MPVSSRLSRTGQFDGVFLMMKRGCLLQSASDSSAGHSSQGIDKQPCVQEFINLHVDECLRRQDVSVSNPRGNSLAAAGKANGGGRRGAANKKLEVPPKLAAHLLSDRQLKEQLKRYELPGIGKKEVRRSACWVLRKQCCPRSLPQYACGLLAQAWRQ